MDQEEHEGLVFKYKRLYLEGENGDYTLDPYTMNYLNSCEIFLAKPTQFNDPFDSWIPFDLHCTKQEFQEELTRFSTEDKTEFEKLIRKIGWDEAIETVNSYADSNEYSKRMIGETIDRLRLHCFSKRFDSLLLWAHYADEHKGICIGVKTIIFNDIQKLKLHVPNKIGEYKVFEYPLVDVEYSEDNRTLPSYRYYSRENIRLDKYLLFKSREWSYEEEKRLVLWNEDLTEQSIHLAPDAIGEVTFGIKTPQSIMEEVIAIVSSENPSGKKINFFQMQRSNDSFALDKVKLKI